MPTACSPRNYASCTSMIGGRLRSVQIPAEGSDSHPFATCVCPIPVSVFHFPFFSLYGPTSFHQKSCHISPFSPAPPSVSRHTFLHFSSPLHRPFVLLHRCLSYPPCTLSFFHIIMYAHVCGCGSAASFASLQVSSPLYIIKGTENKNILAFSQCSNKLYNFLSLYLSSSNHQNEYNFYYHNSFGRNTPLLI